MRKVLRDLNTYRPFLRVIRALFTDLVMGPGTNEACVGQYDRASVKGITGTARREGGYFIITLKVDPFRFLGLK